jgi:hypothetical protein
MQRYQVLVPLLLLCLEVDFLKPSDFRQLPTPFRRQLEDKGCTIPQNYATTTPNNVVSGSFAKKGQRDWAVLCSVKGRSRIVLHWGGSASCREDLPESIDDDYRRDIGAGQIGYSRGIRRAVPADVKKHARDHDAPLHFSVDHDGIDDAFLEKASVIFYCHQGTWHKLQGSD